jgi:hypothetical protein
MPDDVVHSSSGTGPGTHAIVIGIGAYPHLVGGMSNQRFEDHEGMGQLTSPPVSARRFADWLIEGYSSAAAPLRSVRLLLAEETPAVYENPATGAQYDVEYDTAQQVIDEIKAWFAVAGEDTDNIAIFYFCGHGIANGTDTSLLLPDFGRDSLAPMESGIDFRKFHLGMERCAARKQCFFIDACRVASDRLIESLGTAGRAVVEPSARRDASMGFRQAPIFYGTLLGAAAYGRPGEASAFTDALLKGLRGAGSDDAEGDWRVDTSRLASAVEFYMERAALKEGLPRQVNPTDHLTQFFLNYLPNGPEEDVVVYVGCRPDDANVQAQLAYAQPPQPPQTRPAPKPEDWEVTLPTGEYEFSATFPASVGFNTTQKTAPVRPPYRKVPLGVGS